MKSLVRNPRCARTTTVLTSGEETAIFRRLFAATRPPGCGQAPPVPCFLLSSMEGIKAPSGNRDVLSQGRPTGETQPFDPDLRTVGMQMRPSDTNARREAGERVPMAGPLR